MITFLCALTIGVVRAVFLIRNRHRTWRWWLGWGVPIIAAILAVVMVIQDPEPQKFVGRVCMPLGLLWLGLLSGIAVAISQRRWLLMGLLSTAVIIFSLGCSSWVGDCLIHRLEIAIPRPANVDVAHVEAIFVLGGSTSLGTNGDPYVNQAGDRVLLAARLFHLGKTSRLIASGSGFPGIDAERDLAQETATIWRQLGIPADAIEQLPGPINTRQEIEAYQGLCNARGWTNVAVITSAWHLPRALSLGRAAGFQFVPLGADWRSETTPFSLLTLVPTGYGAETVQIACWEWLGIIVNSFRL